LTAERRGRLDKSRVEERLELMAALPIAINVDPGKQTWADTLLLARAERLTSFDAAYLELAIRLDADLASLDRDLLRAAKNMGLGVVP
jgi:predicted nucleic acid-binding protein